MHDKRFDRAKALRATISAIYPQAFDLVSPRPLKVGIRGDILKEFPEIKWRDLSRMLRWLTLRRAYLSAVAKGGPRYDLQGNPGGAITDDEIAYSIKFFHERNERAIDPWPDINTPGAQVHLYRQAAE